MTGRNVNNQRKIKSHGGLVEFPGSASTKRPTVHSTNIAQVNFSGQGGPEQARTSVGTERNSSVVRASRAGTLRFSASLETEDGDEQHEFLTEPMKEQQIEKRFRNYIRRLDRKTDSIAKNSVKGLNKVQSMALEISMLNRAPSSANPCPTTYSETKSQNSGNRPHTPFRSIRYSPAAKLRPGTAPNTRAGLRPPSAASSHSAFGFSVTKSRTEPSAHGPVHFCLID